MKSSLLLIILMVVFVILTLAMVFQVIGMKSKLDSNSNEYIKRLSNMKEFAEDGNTINKGYMGVYSIIVNVNATTRVNDADRLFLRKLQDSVTSADKTFILPTLCSGSIVTRSVESTRYGFLICQANNGSSQLKLDISMNKTMYVIINNTMMLIRTSDVTYDTMLALGIIGEEFHIFVLYVIPQQTTDSVCSIKIIPFMGHTQLADSSTTTANHIDVISITGLGVGGGNAAFVPLQVTALSK